METAFLASLAKPSFPALPETTPGAGRDPWTAYMVETFKPQASQLSMGPGLRRDDGKH